MKGFNMKALLCLLILSPLVLGQSGTCPEQPYLPLAGYSVPVDANEVAPIYPHDPNSAPLLLRPPIHVVLGGTAQADGWACDPDGDGMQTEASAGGVALEEGQWHWSWRPTAIGTYYARIALTDVRLTDDELTAMGTIMVVVVPANRPPRLGCGSRP